MIDPLGGWVVRERLEQNRKGELMNGFSLPVGVVSDKGDECHVVCGSLLNLIALFTSHCFSLSLSFSFFSFKSWNSFHWTERYLFNQLQLHYCLDFFFLLDFHYGLHLGAE